MSFEFPILPRVAAISTTLSAICGAAIAADAPPRWDISEVCAGAKQNSMCIRIENENRQTILSRWNALPATDRSECQAQFDHPGQRSYQRLLNCVDERAMKALDAPASDPKTAAPGQNG